MNQAQQVEQEGKKKVSIWSKGKYFDYSLLFIVLFLVAFGLIMIYSTSSYKAAMYYNDSWYFCRKQAIFAVIGITLMFGISKMNYQRFKIFSKLAIIGTVILMIAVLLIGSASKGSTRWISIAGIRFQPSELAKMALIMYTAHLVTIKVWKLNRVVEILKIAIWPIVVIVLIATENLSTAIICAGIVFMILFVASPGYIKFIVAAIGVAAGGTLFVVFASYRGERIDAWLHPETHPKGFQTMQSLYAIGSGGIFGKGLGQSIQKLGFIPESHNDMIFSVICEELGLFGAFCIIAVFILMLWRFMVIATNAPDLYGALLVIGVMTHISIQVLINIAVVTNTIPPTGVPLPFISYGGSSEVFLLCEMGLVFSVARDIKVRRSGNKARA